MAIEQDIQQKKFKTEKQKLIVNLMYTYHDTVSKIGDLFKAKEITRQQYNVLRILRGQHPNPVSINDLKTRMLDKMSDASRITDRLLSKGLVERKRCKTDRRAVDIKITEAGLNMLKELDPLVSDFEAKTVNLNDDEARQLNSLLDKLRKNGS